MTNYSCKSIVLLGCMLVGLLGTGCVSSEVSFEDVQVTRHHLVFPGASAAIDWNDTKEISSEIRQEYDLPEVDETVALPTQGFSFSKIKTGLPKGVTTSLKLKGVTISAHDKTTDLSFLRQILLTVVEDAADSGNPHIIFDYANDPGENASRHVELAVPLNGGEIDVDLRRLNSMFFELSTWGQFDELPKEAWSIDVTLTLSGAIAVDY